MPKPPIQIEGYKELQSDLKKAGKDAQKALGEAHKEIGKFIISKLDPPVNPLAVGSGAGAKPRPSATKRDLIINVGGKHRIESGPPFVGDPPAGARPYAYKPWGKKHPMVVGSRPPRPHIIGTAREHQQEIIEEFSDKILAAMKPYFWNVN